MNDPLEISVTCQSEQSNIPISVILSGAVAESKNLGLKLDPSAVAQDDRGEKAQDDRGEKAQDDNFRKLVTDFNSTRVILSDSEGSRV